MEGLSAAVTADRGGCCIFLNALSFQAPTPVFEHLHISASRGSKKETGQLGFDVILDLFVVATAIGQKSTINVAVTSLSVR